jgi:class I fructose-bisphosphate aldolase
MNAIHEGGGFGSIIGRNSFQRPQPEAVRLLNAIMDIYQGKSLHTATSAAPAKILRSPSE